jgi:hypothetical protein
VLVSFFFNPTGYFLPYWNLKINSASSRTSVYAPGAEFALRTTICKKIPAPHMCGLSFSRTFYSLEILEKNNFDGILYEINENPEGQVGEVFSAKERSFVWRN